MTYNITLTANHQSLTAEYLPLAAESVQYLTAKVVCETEDWTGREIKAMFGQGCTVHEVTVTGGEITAKQQLNLTAGDWRVWLVGNSARDGDVIPRITTNVARISVAPTGGTEGNPFPTIPPTAEEQLRADMGNLADLTTEDKSSLVAAINEAAASGGSKDAVTYTPQTLTTEQQEQARTNIGAEKAGTAYTKPASGIPKSDLADDVQTSLAKADTAISLGLTAATPGQIIKVKAVQDGKPTEWEAVDLPGEEEWEKIKEITIAEDAGEANALTINADENGNTFRLKKARLCAKFPAYTGTSTIPNYSFAMINGKTTGRVTPLLYTSVWPKISTNTITGTIYYVDVSGAQQIEHAQINGNVGWSDDTAHDYAVYGAVGDNQRTMYGDTLWAKPITSIGGTGMLIYPGCHFVLYGVRE
jgi:hypothetical protein